MNDSPLWLHLALVPVPHTRRRARPPEATRVCRFAPADHDAFLRDDRRARAHAAYGAFDAPRASWFNMNLDAFIKTYCVDRHRRRAFRTVLPAFEFLTGLHRDGGDVPGALPGLIQRLKDRDARDRQPVFHLADKCDASPRYIL